MNNEPSAPAELPSHGQNAPSTTTTPPKTASSSPDAAPQPAPKPPELGPDDFHPTVLAVNRIQVSGKTYAKRTKIAATGKELVRLTGELISSLKDEGDLETALRTQSALMNQAFTALLMKTTRDDGFDEVVFASALRTQKEFRITCQMLFALKKAKEQTEMNQQKTWKSSRARDPFSDPYAHQYPPSSPGV